MALTSAQIIARACVIAKAPGYTAQAGQYLNMLLQTLCQDYDFDFIKKTQVINLTGAAGYALNADHLRTKEVFYNVNGAIYYLFQIPIETYHALFEGAGISTYPNKYAVDVAASPNVLYFYPPPGIALPVTVNYFPQMADISTPGSSSAVPWFLNQEYLITKVAADLMLETDDDRQPVFEKRAERMLEKILDMADDKEGFSGTIKLSRETFRSGDNLPPDKAFPLGG
jgi:hypothetical protein